MAPIIPAILTFLTSIPQIINAIKVIKPVKNKVLEVEKTYNDIGKLRSEANVDKHTLVFKYLKTVLLPRIRKYGFDEYDLDTMIRFVVLFLRKVKKLRAYKTR